MLAAEYQTTKNFDKLDRQGKVRDFKVFFHFLKKSRTENKSKEEY